MESNFRRIDGDLIQILNHPAEIKEKYLSLVRAAENEILVVFPTTNAVRREEKIGIIDELRRAEQRGVFVRILTPEDDFIKERLTKLKDVGINLRRIETSTEAKFKLLVVDRKTSLVVETADDSKSEFFEAVGLATLSISKPTVLPYAAIFESFWKEAELYERAMAADKTKDDFVNIAAHELRNPITPIVAAIQFIERDFASLAETIRSTEDLQAQKMLDSIQTNIAMIGRNTRKLVRLAEDILQVSRIQSGTFSLYLQICDINDIIVNTISDIKKKYQEAKPGVEIRFVRSADLASKPLRISCDEPKVTQILYNLLDNAMKFTDEGAIELDLRQEDNELVFSVTDSGPGIDPIVQEKMFEKFVTKSNGGTGLGLYLSKKIIEAHGGSIWAKNNLGTTGATFVFTLPLDLRSVKNETAETIKQGIGRLSSAAREESRPVN